jgi:hypothetical protein
MYFTVYIKKSFNQNNKKMAAITSNTESFTTEYEAIALLSQTPQQAALRIRHSYIKIMEDAARYRGLPIPLRDAINQIDSIDGIITIKNLAGIKAFTLRIDRIRWSENRFEILIKNLKQYIILKVYHLDDPATINVKWKPVSIRESKLAIYPDNHYAITKQQYDDLLIYANNAAEMHDGLAMIPCKDENDKFYIYIGLYRDEEIPTGERVTKQNNDEIILLIPGGPGGDGNGSGFRIPS